MASPDWNGRWSTCAILSFQAVANASGIFHPPRPPTAGIHAAANSTPIAPPAEDDPAPSVEAPPVSPMEPQRQSPVQTLAVPPVENHPRPAAPVSEPTLPKPIHTVPEAPVAAPVEDPLQRPPVHTLPVAPADELPRPADPIKDVDRRRSLTDQEKDDTAIADHLGVPLLAVRKQVSTEEVATPTPPKVPKKCGEAGSSYDRSNQPTPTPLKVQKTCGEADSSHHRNNHPTPTPPKVQKTCGEAGPSHHRSNYPAPCIPPRVRVVLENLRAEAAKVAPNNNTPSVPDDLDARGRGKTLTRKPPTPQRLSGGTKALPTSGRVSTPQGKTSPTSRVRSIKTSRRLPKSATKAAHVAGTSRQRKPRKKADPWELEDDASFDDGYNHLFNNIAVNEEDFTETEASEDSSAHLRLSDANLDPSRSEGGQMVALMENAYSIRK